MNGTTGGANVANSQVHGDVIGGNKTEIYYPAVAATNSGVQTNNHEIELLDLLLLFTVNEKGVVPGWSTGASPDSPIEWDTDGLSGAIPQGVLSRNCNAARHGKTTVTIKGNPTHKQFGKTVHPAVWNISIFGSRGGGIECVQISSVYSDCASPLKVAAAVNQYLEFKDMGPGHPLLPVARLYKLSLPDRQPCWLVESCIRTNEASYVAGLTLFPTSAPWTHSFLNELLPQSPSANDPLDDSERAKTADGWHPPELPPGCTRVSIYDAVGSGGSCPVSWPVLCHSTAVSGRVINNRFYIDVTIPCWPPVSNYVTLSGNRFLHVAPGLPWEINYSARDIEVVDYNTNPLCQVEYRQPYSVVVKGPFPVDAPSSARSSMPTAKFKYPSSRFLGVYAE